MVSNILQVFRNKLEFFAAAKVSSSFPSPDLPEIAFAGIKIYLHYHIKLHFIFCGFKF